MEEHKLEIPKNYFCDSNDLTMSMNRLLSEQLKKILYFDNIKGFFRVVAKTEQSFVIKFPESLCPSIGMYDYLEGEASRIFKGDNYQMFAVKKDSLYEAPQLIDIFKLYPGVMICYANFVQHSIIRDKFYPILRIIPTSVNQNKMTTALSISSI